MLDRRGLSVPRTGPLVARLKARVKDELRTLSKRAAYSLGNAIYSHRYHTLCRALGDLPHHLVDQEALARPRTRSTTAWRAAARDTSRSARTSSTRRNRGAHMVLSLKPFGCMPSTQSDGVQSTVAAQGEERPVPADRNGGRGRAARAQPRADGAGRGAAAGRAGVRPGARVDREEAGRDPPLRRRARGAAQPVPPRAGEPGRGRRGRELRAPRQPPDRPRPRVALQPRRRPARVAPRQPTSRCHDRFRTEIPPRPRRGVHHRQGRGRRRFAPTPSCGATTSGTRAGPPRSCSRC